MKKLQSPTRASSPCSQFIHNSTGNNIPTHNLRRTATAAKRERNKKESGFCVSHFWSNGKQLTGRKCPFFRRRASGKSLCLMPWILTLFTSLLPSLSLSGVCVCVCACAWVVGDSSWLQAHTRQHCLRSAWMYFGDGTSCRWFGIPRLKRIL